MHEVFRVNVNPDDGWGWYRSRKPGVANCGLLHITIRKSGTIFLNNEVVGSLSDLEVLRERLLEIIEERQNSIVVLALDTDREEYLGYRTAVAEYQITASPNTNYGDVIRVVDLLMSLGDSSVILNAEYLD
ncbi:MAG: hypothetical protein IPM63_18660 [Acidobacteriota bacterium]|nr:MAG: hypothetical protein IPM63_18660 [Acidobacteriota bacterium]